MTAGAIHTPAGGAEALRISIGGLERELPIVPVPSGQHIAFLDVLGDVELIRRASRDLVALLPADVQLLVGPETGGIVITHQMALDSGLPYVILRKKLKPHMRQPFVAEVRSIGAAGGERLYLGETAAQRIRGTEVALVDEVISSGSTLAAMESLITLAGGRVACRMAIATEGTERSGVVALCHLPLFGCHGTGS